MSTASAAVDRAVAEKTAYPILAIISLCHFLNDMMQSLLPAVYPLFKEALHLDFGQIGLITFTNQLVASFLQPVVGFFGDRRARPYSLAAGMGFTLLGLLLLSVGARFWEILVAAALIGVGSSVFHPESSRVARMAAGAKPGFAQSIFQVGGNAGMAAAPLLAYVVYHQGQSSIAWFSAAAFAGIVLLIRIGNWAKNYYAARLKRGGAKAHDQHGLPSRKVAWSVAILVALIFSKFVYTASLHSYYTFYLIHEFHVSVETSQIYLFLFLGAAAVGTILGGPIGDRIGRKYVIWVSILGPLPFTLLLPYVNLFWTAVCSVMAGLIMASALPAIVVYAQELLPGRIGMISGLFFGLGFGIGGVGAALMGELADATSIAFVYRLCAFLPLIGLLTAALPDIEGPRRNAAASGLDATVVRA